MGGTAQLLRVVREGVLGLGHADRQPGGTEGLDLLNGLFSPGGVLDPVGPVNIAGDFSDLLLDGHLQRVELVEMVLGGFRPFDDRQYRFSELDAAFAALGEDFRQGVGDPQLLAAAVDDGDFGVGVAPEPVDRDDDRDAEAAHILDVGFQVDDTLLQRPDVLRPEVGFGDAAVIFQRPHRRNDDRAGRGEPGVPALDVEEFLRPEVGAEPCLSDAVIPQLEGQLGRPDRVAAVGDVGKGAAVDEDRGVFEGLDEVRLNRVLHQGRHRPVRLQVAGVYRLIVVGPGDEDVPHPLFEVLQILGKAEDCHDFRRDGDDKPVLPGDAVGFPAEANDRMPQRPVIHVHTALKEDPSGINAEGVPLLDMVVDHRAEEVVGGGNRVHIAGEVEVDVLHRDDLGIPAAGGAALDAEDRAEGRFPQGEDRLFPEPGHRLAEADRRGGLAFAGRGGVDGGDEDQLAVGAPGELFRQPVREFCLILAVELKAVGIDAEAGRHLGDREHMGLLGNFNISEHASTFLSSKARAGTRAVTDETIIAQPPAACKLFPRFLRKIPFRHMTIKTCRAAHTLSKTGLPRPVSCGWGGHPTPASRYRKR